jgi:DNA polymerase delta subunit 1
VSNNQLLTRSSSFFCRDSVFVKFHIPDAEGPDKLKKHFELAERVAAETTKLFKKPNDLEFEKVYWPMLLYGKKVRESL